MNEVRTVEQKRSEFALNCIENVLKEANEGKLDEKLPENYKSLVKKFPMMVLKNGLLQTVVFLEAKGKKHHNTLLKNLRIYLELVSPLSLKIEVSCFSEYLSETEVHKYRNITTDILAFAKWLGRYAEALIEQEAESE